MWGPPVSFIPFPKPADRCPFFSSPLDTPRRSASNLGMPSKVFTPRLDPPSKFLPLTPHQAAPPSMALRPLPLAVSPSPASACPSPTTTKGRGAPPGHHHTHPALICSLPSPQRSCHRAPPPSIVPHCRPAVSDPPPPPLAAGEAHRYPLPLFPQPRRGSTHGGTIPAILRRATTEMVSVVHCGPVPPTVHKLVDLVHAFSFRKTIPGNSNFQHFALRTSVSLKSTHSP
jgi:hypothetical protein